MTTFTHELSVKDDTLHFTPLVPIRGTVSIQLCQFKYVNLNKNGVCSLNLQCGQLLTFNGIKPSGLPIVNQRFVFLLKLENELVLINCQAIDLIVSRDPTEPLSVEMVNCEFRARMLGAMTDWQHNLYYNVVFFKDSGFAKATAHVQASMLMCKFVDQGAAHENYKYLSSWKTAANPNCILNIEGGGIKIDFFTGAVQVE